MYFEGSYYYFLGSIEGVHSDGSFCSMSNEANSVTVSDVKDKVMCSYSGASSMFMTVLLNKKYSLPYVVLDSLVEYFMSFEEDERELPVLWHQVG